MSAAAEVEGKGVADDGKCCGAALGHGKTCFDGRGIHPGALSDHGRRHTFERELLVCQCKPGVGNALAVLVLHDLLHDAVEGRLVGLNNVGRDRRQSGLARCKGSTLTGAHDDVALCVASGENRRQHVVLLNASHELARKMDLGAHIRLDHDEVRVDVLHGAEWGGGVGHWVLSPSTYFSACLARDSIESGSAGVQGRGISDGERRARICR